MATICDRWRLSNKEQDRATWLVAHHGRLTGAASLRWSVVQPLLVAPGAIELVALHAAEGAVAESAVADRFAADVEFCRTRLALPPEELNPQPLIGGDDLSAHGVPKGAIYRTLLERVRNAQLDGEICDRVEALKLVDRLLAEGGPHRIPSAMTRCGSVAPRQSCRGGLRSFVLGFYPAIWSLGGRIEWKSTISAWYSVGCTFCRRLSPWAVRSLCVALLPAVAELPESQRPALHEAIRSRWSKWVMGAILFLLISGFYNFFTLTGRYQLPKAYHMLFGIKFLLALAIFTLASFLTGRTAVAQRMRQNARPG